MKPESKEFIARKIADGTFADDEEVLDAALEAMRQLEKQKEALRADIAEGIKSLDEGRYGRSIPEIIADAKAQHAKQ